MENQLPIEIKSFEEAQEILVNTSNSLDGFYKKIIDTQIEAIKILKNPLLVKACIDNILENLREANKFITNEEDLYVIKKESNSLIQGVLFLFYSNILMTKEKNKKEAIELSKTATNFILDFSVVVVQAKLCGGVTLIAAAKKAAIIQCANFLKNNSNSVNKKENFISRTYKLILNSDKNAEQDYFLMLDGIFDKFDRHKEMIGESIVLSELIRNHSSEIIKHTLKNDLKQLENKKNKLNNHQLTILNDVFLILYPIIFIGVFAIFIYDKFSSNSIDFSFVKWLLLSPILFYIVKFYYDKRKLNIEFENLNKSNQEKENNLIEKYNRIADSIMPKYA